MVVGLVAGLTILFAFDDWLVILLVRELEFRRIRDPWFLLAGVVVACTNVLLAMAVYRVLRRKPVSGKEGMLGATGVALQTFRGEGLVSVHGEIWRASCSQPVRKNQTVRVKSVDGLVLVVEPEGGGRR